MTRTTNARIAGFTFLVYIAVGITSMVLFAPATSGEGVAAQLAAMAQHAIDVRLAVLLGPPVTSFMRFPMLAFEIALALWLIVKGVASPVPEATGLRLLPED